LFVLPQRLWFPFLRFHGCRFVYYFLISSNCVYLYIYIYIYIYNLHLYIYIFILYYISFYTLCTLTHTLSFPPFFPSLHTYIFIHIKQHNASNKDITHVHTRTHASSLIEWIFCSFTHRKDHEGNIRGLSSIRINLIVN